MKKTILLLPVLGLSLCLISGCATNKAYTTLAAAEQSVDAAYKAYNDLLVQGKVSTNSAPTVAKAYNNFQLTVTVATAMANGNSNAPAPTNLVSQASSVISTIYAAEGK